MEDNTRATLADLLTCKENPLLVKEESVPKVESVAKVGNAHGFFFNGS